VLAIYETFHKFFSASRSCTECQRQGMALRVDPIEQASKIIRFWQPLRGSGRFLIQKPQSQRCIHEVRLH
jgi:hypothetical protein